MRTKPCGHKDVWFAWRPVRVGYNRQGPIVWLEKVERTKNCFYTTKPWYSYWYLEK